MWKQYCRICRRRRKYYSERSVRILRALFLLSLAQWHPSLKNAIYAHIFGTCHKFRNFRHPLHAFSSLFFFFSFFPHPVRTGLLMPSRERALPFFPHPSPHPLRAPTPLRATSKVKGEKNPKDFRLSLTCPEIICVFTVDFKRTF